MRRRRERARTAATEVDEEKQRTAVLVYCGLFGVWALASWAIEQPDAAQYGLPQQSVFGGRPEIRSILGSVKANGILRHAVYFCGPRPLCDATWAATSDMSDESVQFAFHHETFEF